MNSHDKLLNYEGFSENCGVKNKEVEKSKDIILQKTNVIEPLKIDDIIEVPLILKKHQTKKPLNVKKNSKFIIDEEILQNSRNPSPFERKSIKIMERLTLNKVRTESNKNNSHIKYKRFGDD